MIPSRAILSIHILRLLRSPFLIHHVWISISRISLDHTLEPLSSLIVQKVASTDVGGALHCHSAQDQTALPVDKGRALSGSLLETTFNRRAKSPGSVPPFPVFYILLISKTQAPDIFRPPHQRSRNISPWSLKPSVDGCEICRQNAET